MGRKCMLGRDIIPLLCRSSQHWGEVFLHHNPTSTVRSCACSRPLLCVMLWLYWQGYSLFGKNRQIEHSNFKGKYTTLFCKRILRTWEKEKGWRALWVVHSSVQMRSPYHTMHPLPYRSFFFSDSIWHSVAELQKGSK